MDGHNLILPATQPAGKNPAPPPTLDSEHTCKDNIIYMIAGVRCSYRPKVLLYDTDESTAVAPGLCFLSCAWPHKCRPRNSGLLSVLAATPPAPWISVSPLVFCVDNTYPVQNKRALLHFLG